MKRILLMVLIAVMGIHTASAQIFGKKKKTQEEATDVLAYTFSYLKSDTLRYKTLMLRDTSLTIGMLHDNKGNPMYVIMPRTEIDSINLKIKRMASDPQYGILGLEFNLTYIEDFSYQSMETIKDIKDKYQKNMTKTFNKKIKYILMQQSPRAVRGKRIVDPKDKNYGKVVPDFTALPPTEPTLVPKDTLKKSSVEQVPEKQKESLPTYPPIEEPSKKSGYEIYRDPNTGQFVPPKN
jgi:hypothetical protein